jgi:tRNA pseudouridine55 synthase
MEGLLLDKPVGITSNRALQQVKKLFKARKAGHAGTLDPLASGLLIILFGEATKFAGHLLEDDKEYLATLKLGEKTATGDAEGEVIEKKPVQVSEPGLAARAAELQRGNKAGAADAFGAQARRGAAVRARPRG